MSASKKPLKKRKRQSPPPPSSSSKTTSHISRRLEKIRRGQLNLWDGDDDDDDNHENTEQPEQSKPAPSNKTYIVLSDSDDDNISTEKRAKITKSKKKLSRNQDENISSDNDHKINSKCSTCLICSILTTLTSYNCCQKHLSLLVNHNKNNCHNNHQKQTIDNQEWPPQQVMIVPMTDELIQRYLHSSEIYQLKKHTSTSPISQKSTSSKKSTRKLPKKSTATSDTEHSNIQKTKTADIQSEQINSSGSIIDRSLPNSGTNPDDVTYTLITSTSTTINSFESPNLLDTCQLQQSSDQPIIIDDSQTDNCSNININPNGKKTNDPWTPISDDTYAAIEVALDQQEFTPAVARRTPTELMASCLPKIQLKKGRFRQGKPVNEQNLPDTTTTTTNDCHSLLSSSSSCSSTSSSISTSTSVITTNTRLPLALATIVEDEALIIQSSGQISAKSSQRQDDTTEGLSDTVMSRLLAQDELSQHDNIPIPVKLVSNEVLPPPSIIVEDYSHENDVNKSVDISQSSQLTNDQNDTQPFTSSTTTNENKTPTPTRVSYRLNPDGSRVSISRPAMLINHQSQLNSSRRTSTDVSTSTSHGTN